MGLESDSTAAIHALTSSNPAPTPMAALLHVHEADDFGLEVRLGMPVAYIDNISYDYIKLELPNGQDYVFPK